MRTPIFFTIMMLCTSVTSGAGDLQLQKGPWELVLDQQSGVLRSLNWNKQTVCENPTGKEPFNWGPEWQTSRKETKCILRGMNWNDQTGTLILSFYSGEWVAEEILNFGVLNRPDRLGLTLRLTYHPEKGGNEPVKFNDVVFNLPLPKKGRYLFPVNRSFTATDQEGDLAQLSPGTTRSGSYGTWPLLVGNGGNTAIFMPDARRDSAKISMEAGEQSICVKNIFHACGWAYPNESQTIGPLYLEMYPAALPSAMREGIWRLYDEMGLKVPADTPDWVRDAILYSFHPGGSTGSNWKDLGGFVPAREELLPQLTKLGFNAIWILPVEDKSPYWPRDYYRFADGLGTGEEYAALIDAAHSRGMKVWQDNVPHGGAPSSGSLRGNKPWQLVFDENGDALSYWCFDFGNPDWQRYIADVVENGIRKYKLDGYRVDACGGSRIPNWRKKDFPSAQKTPKNVPDEWWKQSLLPLGGKMPPLPYERASLSTRQGGLQMLKGIRAAVRRSNPTDGAVLGEVQYAPYMQEVDAIYDFDFCGLMSQMRTTSPEVFARGLARWLEEQKFSEPRGTLRMRYVESHDSLRAAGWAGRNAARAMMAVSMFIHGTPMIYQDGENGEGIFLKKLIAIRKALPELRRGAAEYRTAAPGSVFSCLREMKDMASIALINLGPNAASTSVALPQSLLAATRGEWSAWDCTNGQRIATGEAAALGSLPVTLAPWDYQIIAFRLAGAPCPVAITPEPAVTQSTQASSMPVTITERENELEVTASAYSLVLDKTSGLPRIFSDHGGTTILEKFGIVGGPDTQRTVQHTANVRIKSESTPSGGRIEVSATFSQECSLRLIYHCLAQELRLEAALTAPEVTGNLGLLFAAPGTGRWQVRTAEGLLDDFFQTRHLNGIASADGNIYYRTQGGPVLWQAKTVPLDPARPVMCVMRGQSGCEISVTEPLSGALDNVQILDKFLSNPCWHAAFFWRDNSAWEKPTAGHPQTFSLTIKPAAHPLTQKKDAEKTRIGALTLENVSSGWQVKNQHYSLKLLRTGGIMQTLRRANANENILDINDLYTDRGFSTKHLRAAASNDVETGVRIWREEDRLHMLFSGMLRGDYRFDKLKPPVWFSTEYVFDQSAAFRVNSAILCEGIPIENPPFLAWTAASNSWSKATFYREGKELCSGAFNTNTRTAETAALPGSPLPDTIRICGKSTELRLTDIRYPPQLPAQNVFIKGNQLFFVRLENENKTLTPATWYEFAMTITSGVISTPTKADR